MFGNMINLMLNQGNFLRKKNSFQRFEEYGVMRRELLFWHPMKPQCVRTPSMIPIHTSLEDFYPPLAIWSVGVVLSLQILVFEILWWRRETRSKEPYAYTN